MVIKTAIALFLTASLAGGAVYYGTQGTSTQNGEVSLGEHPHKSDRMDEDIASIDTEVASINTEVEVETVTNSSNVSKIDRLLKRDNNTEEIEVSDESELKKLISESETAEEATDGAEIGEVQIDEPVTEFPVFEENNKQPEIRSSDDLFVFAISQAERIETPEIRDQAYLDIIDYACRNQDYQQAQATTLKIVKVQMRDKARSRIAISMAQRGKGALAMEEIDKVETKESQDVMRLQVLQALIQN